MKSVLKTVTLGRSNDPSIVLCPGHVTAKVFNQAFKDEGWSGGGTYRQEDLAYEYWTMTIRKGKELYKPSLPNKKNAQPFTFTRWD